MACSQPFTVRQFYQSYNKRCHLCSYFWIAISSIPSHVIFKLFSTFFYTYIIYSPVQRILCHFLHIFSYSNKSTLVLIYQSVVKSYSGNVSQDISLMLFENTKYPMLKKSNKREKKRSKQKQSHSYHTNQRHKVQVLYI